MIYKAYLFINIALLLAVCGYAQESSKNNMYKSSTNETVSFAQEEKIFRQIYDEALGNPKAYTWLAHLCKNIGGRLSGSPQNAQAVQFTKQIMDTLGLDKVYLQEVQVPHWVRGAKEEARIISKQQKIKVNVCALGGSVATNTKGLTASIIEVTSFDELRNLGKEKVANNIVFFNVKMNPKRINTFTAYGEVGLARRQGASEAAKYGAVGVIIRSLTVNIDEYPHTGSMVYLPNIPKIPAIAICTADAERLSAIIKKEPTARFYFKTACQTLPDVTSHNVIGEIKGTTYPDEILLAGGHLDSWDLAEGAHDDGAGCMQALEAIAILRRLNIKPKRTIRVVLFANEENGVRGGRKYAELAEQNKEKHIFALESDAGGFVPLGFSLANDDETFEKFLKYKPLFKPYNILLFEKGGGGVDISFLEKQGTVLCGLSPDSQRYFDYHHTAIDTFDKVNARELQLGAAAIAAMLYLVATYGL